MLFSNRFLFDRKFLVRTSVLNASFHLVKIWPEVTLRGPKEESASHHFAPWYRAPHNTAHMRQHGKFENFDVWNRDFMTFWAKIWYFSDLYKIYDFDWKYQQKTVFDVSLMILEGFLINSRKYQNSWKNMSFLRYVTGPRSQVYHLKKSMKWNKT